MVRTAIGRVRDMREAARAWGDQRPGVQAGLLGSLSFYAVLGGLYVMALWPVELLLAVIRHSPHVGTSDEAVLLIPAGFKAAMVAMAIALVMASVVLGSFLRAIIQAGPFDRLWATAMLAATTAAAMFAIGYVAHEAAGMIRHAGDNGWILAYLSVWAFAVGFACTMPLKELSDRCLAWMKDRMDRLKG